MNYSNLTNSHCLFVIAQGRSGSTLLLRMLNEIEGYNICGENFNAVEKLADFYYLLQKITQQIPKIEGVQNRFPTYEELEKWQHENYSGFEWYNIYDLKIIKQKLREIIVTMFNPNFHYKVWGFKEIRLGFKTNYEQLERQLNFITLLFPQAKFIFNTRNVENLIKSAWWAEKPEENKKYLQKQQHLFKEYCIAHPQNTYQISYEDMIENTIRLHDMYDFLGLSFKIEAYKKVIKR